MVRVTSNYREEPGQALVAIPGSSMTWNHQVDGDLANINHKYSIVVIAKSTRSREPKKYAYLIKNVDPIHFIP